MTCCFFFAVLVAVAVIAAFKLKKLLLFFSFFTNRAYYSMLLCKNPPNMKLPLRTTVKVGPFLSHFEWNDSAAKPSREALNRRRYLPVL